MKVGGLIGTSSMLQLGSAIVAQADPSGGAAGWLSVVIQLGSFGLVAFLIIHGLPVLQRELKVERKAERDDFTRALETLNSDRKAERADFNASLKTITDFARTEVEVIRAAAKAEVETLRADAKANIEALRNTFQHEQRETRTFYAGESESMRKMYFDSVAAMRTAVHDVRDAAGAVINKAAVAVEVAKAAKAGA